MIRFAMGARLDASPPEASSELDADAAEREEFGWVGQGLGAVEAWPFFGEWVYRGGLCIVGLCLFFGLGLALSGFEWVVLR